MIDEDDDRILVSRFLARRDEAVFRALYRRHSPFLYRFLLRLTGGRAAEAEEGVQETWIRAVEGLGGFAWRSSLKTWLAGIAIHWSRERARRLRREESLPDEEAVPAPPIRREIERLDLERAVAALPAGYREALVLHDVEGYTHDEVARLRGIEVGTSKSQLSRARRALRALLTGGPHEGR
jgi:RNA polymerase sigma-70 factor, ECF subfamily